MEFRLIDLILIDVMQKQPSYIWRLNTGRPNKGLRHILFKTFILVGASHYISYVAVRALSKGGKLERTEVKMFSQRTFKSSCSKGVTNLSSKLTVREGRKYEAKHKQDYSLFASYSFNTSRIRLTCFGTIS